MKKIIVIAGGYAEYKEFLYDIRYGVEHFFYADSSELTRLMGIEASHVITVGTGMWRPNYEELLKIAKLRIK